ncbi:hypothetical protein BGZ46_002441 [Entomortierella lignicola]|nr:hypothetical protein BGZ46_002441 [Entomortierella lignicola]
MAAPAFAKTWDVKIVNGAFSPSSLDIAPGDTVRWVNNDGAQHAFVETDSGCIPKVGGFNSGSKPIGQPYVRTFHSEGVVNYKDGIGANCAKLNSIGSINVSAKISGQANGLAATTITASDSASATGTATDSASATGSSSGSATDSTAATSSGTSSSTGTATTSTSMTSSSTSSTTSSTPTETHKNSANSLMTQGSFAFGLAAFIGALVGF